MMEVTDEMVIKAVHAYQDEEIRVFGEVRTPNNGARHGAMRAALEAALSHAAGQEAVAWRTIKPCGLRRHMTQAQYDANPNVQKWYEPFKCADCRATAQPPASAEVGRDAARYRWWRENCAFSSWQGDVKVHHDLDMSLGADIDGCRSNMDAAIDAAIAASSGRKD